MIKIIKYLKSRFTDVKKCYKTKQAVALVLGLEDNATKKFPHFLNYTKNILSSVFCNG